MASTHFTTGTTITSEWLNDVNDAVYEGNITAEGVQYTPPFTGGVTETVEAKLAQTVSVKDFGAVGDGVTDDTAAIQDAYAAATNIIFPTGIYAVTHLTWTGANKIIDFQGGAKLYGIATTAQDSVLTLHNFRQAKIINLEIETDGNTATPVYRPNYSCALRLTSDSGSSPTQFLTIDGLYIRYFQAGLVSGNFLGDAAQPSYPQSEIFIRDYKVRGVMQQFYQNATNSYITTSGCVYVTQQFEASSWWNNSNAFNLRADEGDVVSVGDEFQAARSTGYNIYGKNIKITAPVWEHSCPNYITGNISISDMTNGYFGSGSNNVFNVDTAATGNLTLNNVNIRRPDGTASFSASLFVNAKNCDDYKISITNSKLKEFAYNTNASNAYFVLGGQVFLDNLQVDNSASTAASFYFTRPSVNIIGFDVVGQSMSTTLDNTAKGGFTATTFATFAKYTASLPTGYLSAIRFVTTGSTGSVTTPTGTSGIRVIGGVDMQLQMFLKRLGLVSNATIIINWYDYAGSLISSTNVFSADTARMTANGFDDWQQLRSAVTSPKNATYASLDFALGSSVDFAITGVNLL